MTAVLDPEEQVRALVDAPADITRTTIPRSQTCRAVPTTTRACRWQEIRWQLAIAVLGPVASRNPDLALVALTSADEWADTTRRTAAMVLELVRHGAKQPLGGR